jgi:hypothetical protein
VGKSVGVLAFGPLNSLLLAVALSVFGHLSGYRHASRNDEHGHLENEAAA